MAAMMHSDMLSTSSWDDDDQSVDSEGSKRRRSSALSSLASKHSDSPRGSFTGTDTSVLFTKDSAGNSSGDFIFSFPSKSAPSFAPVTTNGFTLEALGASISRNFGDMKQMAPFSLELPIFESSQTSPVENYEVEALDEPCSLASFFPSRR
jgi:hypothetical protein